MYWTQSGAKMSREKITCVYYWIVNWPDWVYFSLIQCLNKTDSKCHLLSSLDLHVYLIHLWIFCDYDLVVLHTDVCPACHQMIITCCSFSLDKMLQTCFTSNKTHCFEQVFCLFSYINCLVTSLKCFKVAPTSSPHCLWWNGKK